MTTIQKYFLCMFAFNAFSLSAMENENELVIHKIKNKIDFHHLGINKNDCCKTIKTPITSYYKTCFLSKNKAAQEIQKIQSYIPGHFDNNLKKRIFLELSINHSYVWYLMDILEQDKFEQFKNVNGSTLDALYQPNFTGDIYGSEKAIYNAGKREYCKYLGSSTVRIQSGASANHYHTDRNKAFLINLYYTASINSSGNNEEWQALNKSHAKKIMQENNLC